MAQEGRAAVVPPQRHGGHSGRPRSGRLVGQGAVEIRRLGRQSLSRCRLPRGARFDRAPLCLYRTGRRADAVLRQSRRLRGFRHHGGYLGNRWLVRSDRPQLPHLGRRRHRWRARAVAGRAGDRRGQLLHRRACRSGGRRGGARRLGPVHGRLSRSVDKDRRPRQREGAARRGAALLGGGVRHAAGQAHGGRLARPRALLRRDRQAGGRANARQDEHQRTAAGLIMPADPVAIAQNLVRCRSVTPAEGGALEFLDGVLRAAGFTVQRPKFVEPGTAEIENLYARIGTQGPHLVFAGHTDVVPPGDETAWTHGPFAGEIHDGVLFGRGAVDMKGGVACFVAAALDYLAGVGGKFSGSISFLITGDEEDIAVNGTLAVNGKQGHVAYPDRADNPIRGIVRIMSALMAEPLDQGSAHFDPSNLEFTSIDVGNRTVNVIPAEVRARFNIRFNDHHTRDVLKALIERRAAAACAGARWRIDWEPSNADVFLTQPSRFVELVSGAVAEVTGRAPQLSTAGGTSDARFIKDYCPVIEFGLVGDSMHQVDERTAVADLAGLTAVYRRILEKYFAA